MRELWRAALIIARRDYVASVWSRTFLLFLLGPLLPLLAGGLFGALGSDIDRRATHPTIAVIAAPADAAALVEARSRLARRLGDDTLPALRPITPAPAAGRAAQVRAVLADKGDAVVAVTDGGLAAPRLLGPRAAVAEHIDALALLYDEARRQGALDRAGAAPPPVEVRAVPVGQAAAGNDAAARMMTARLAQLVLMMLTMILAGMLLSNLIEEKSNKVIEVLAAAVPIDAIFLGKLIAMLGMSLTGIAIWGATAAGATASLFPQVAALPAPAVGWGAFAVLGVVYFVACYLLLGAVFLGIGAQASTVREVQTLSMPVTMGQLGVVAFASSVVGAPDSALALGAMLFPWSSPFAMLARAAEAPALWPHVLAIGWQALWVALTIRFASVRFRRSVLKSGGRRGWFRRRRAPAV